MNWYEYKQNKISRHFFDAPSIIFAFLYAELTQKRVVKYYKLLAAKNKKKQSTHA